VASTLRPLVPGVLVASSRRFATTTTAVVAEGGGVLLVDPAWEPDELTAHARCLRERGLHVAAGLATHVHHDHLLWHPAYGDVPRWASPGTARWCHTHRSEGLEKLDAGWPDELAELFGRVSALPGPSVPWPGPVVEAVFHDGHATGHLAAWVPEHRLLVAGDMLSDVEIPLPFSDGGLGAYVAALDTLAPYVARADVLVPGHGTPTASPASRLDLDRRYLDAVLAGRRPDDPRLANPGMAEAHTAVVALAR